MGGVVFVGLEVEEAARVGGPSGGHAGTRLVKIRSRARVGHSRGCVPGMRRVFGRR